MRSILHRPIALTNEVVVANGPDFQRLLRNSLGALLLCAALALLCYRFVDRTVAFYVYERKFADRHALKWLTYPTLIARPRRGLVLSACPIRGDFRKSLG
jgi:hypothetical protein